MITLVFHILSFNFTFQIAGLIIRKQQFLETVSESDEFLDLKFDGILGLSNKQTFNSASTFKNMADQNLIKEKVFGFYIKK